MFGGIEYLFDPGKRLYWGYILTSLIIGGVWLFFHKKNAKILLSKKLWLHKSAKLDYVYFVISFFIKVFLIVPMIVSAKSVAFFVRNSLIEMFDLFEPTSISYQSVIILFTCTLFVASDFSRYWVHRWLHNVPILWELHKIHHSARVLTPFTFYRIHPIENLLFGFRYALVVGFVTGIFLYMFGAKIGVYEIIGVNAFVFIFSFLGSNLRHSHVSLAYPKWLEGILISPKQHQMHHSTKYMWNNFGGYLAIWDNMFGSLKKSHEAGHLRFGLRNSQMPFYQSVSGLLFTPFKKYKG